MGSSCNFQRTLLVRLKLSRFQKLSNQGIQIDYGNEIRKYQRAKSSILIGKSQEPTWNRFPLHFQ